MSEKIAFSEDPEIQKNRWWIITAIGLFTFMSTLDTSIVNIAIPTISRDLHVSMSQTEWVATVYLLVVCSLLLLFGKIGDLIGKIKVFKIGMIIFTIGSFLCGFNVSFWMLLASRLIQGVGASMTMSTNNGIITEVFKDSERGRSLGWIGTFVALGSIAGPGIGGIILGFLPWGYIFWINIPVGIFAYLLGVKVLPKDITFQKSPVDYGGSLTFSLAIISIVGLMSYAQLNGFLNLPVLILAIIFIVSFLVFIRIELKSSHPLVELSLFKKVPFSISLISVLLIFIGNFAFNVVGPYYLQNLRGMNPSRSGIVLMAFPIAQVIFSPIAGRLTDKYGSELLIRFGICAIILSQIGFCFFSASSPIWFVILIIGILGFGNGLFQSPNNALTMASIEVENLGIAGGLNALFRNLGMVFGLTISTTILFSAMSFKAGHKVVSYVNGRPDLFLYGMKVLFIVMMVLSLIALILNMIKFNRKSR
ncbi:MFS transporter [Xylocopilactobacillus apicola]|uniref:MFS transporter n=1 Tax=Xylocopilactobacillus apicola TaxID=2932184 RepID=A0AAU9D9Q4_9LACO|nr:MFS transporter [Xylocopilactobacillus apicola]BDR58225.1 MFS transporter [Xylocopilactobacillus apicola]